MTNIANSATALANATCEVIARQDTRELLQAGYTHFDAMQYGAARECFMQLLAQDPDDQDAALALNLVTQVMVPRWHFSMLNDIQRNDAYDAAIRALVDTSTTVLDVGSGSGLLAMMAARAGARRVYTCEMNPPIAEMARRIVAENGFGDRIKVIAKKSNELILGEDLSAKVDLLITETLDSQLLGEGIIPIVRDARERLLVDRARVIPHGARVYGALIESEEVWGLNRVTQAGGFDVSLFNAFSTGGAYPVRLTRFAHRFLTPSAEFCSFDFEHGALDPRGLEIPMRAAHTGHCHAVAFWYVLDLGANNTLSSAPDNAVLHWKQAFQCFPEPIALVAGREYMLSVHQHATGFEYALRDADCCFSW